MNRESGPVRAFVMSVCGALLALGCGSTSSSSGPMTEAGAGGSATSGENGGGTGGGGSEDGGDANGGSAGSPVLEAGSCGVARTIDLPSEQSSWQAKVTRQGESLVLGPWHMGELASQLRAYVVDESGQNARFFAADGARNDVSWSLLLSGAGLALDVFVAGGGGGLDDDFASRTFADGDQVAQARGTILNAYWRGTDIVSLLPALDGQSGVLAVWPQAISEPRAALIGPDGARLGDVHSFVVPDAFSRCQAVTPTAHGAFISFVDNDDAWHLTELDGNGAVALELTWPLPTAGNACPVLALADSGLAFLLNRAAAEAPADVAIYRVDASGAISETALPPGSEPGALAFYENEPLLLVGSAENTALALPQRGLTFPIRLPPGTPTRVPSEASSIWLDVDSTDEGRKLVQLTCR